MNLLINTNNSDIPTLLLKNSIKNERKGNNNLKITLCFLELFLSYYYQNYSFAASTNRKLGPADFVPTQYSCPHFPRYRRYTHPDNIPVSRCYGGRWRKSICNTEYIKLAIQQLLQNACLASQEQKIISFLI